MNATKKLFAEALLAELRITAPDLALGLASREASRTGRTVVLPTLTDAFASVDAAMSGLHSHEDRN